MKRYCISALLLCMILLLIGICYAEGGRAVPGGVSYEHIGDYSIERLNKILTGELAEFSTFPIKYPPARNAVSLYRVTYNTVIPEKDNRPVTVTGLAALPKVQEKKLPMVSYQHGTVFSRTEVPSSPEESMETRLMIARFAGQGYMVIAADYIGKGKSNEPDSYMVKESTMQACLDMLMASKILCADLKIEQGDLFLSGWSQGAWSTMMFRNRLESLGIPVKAAATAATPCDLYAAMTRWINNRSEYDATWIVGTVALLINSYEDYYGLQGLSQAAIKPKYWQTAKDFYHNKIGWAQAGKVFPPTAKEFLNDDFAAESSLASNRFFARLQENQAYRWRYATPTRYYYGKIDECIAPYIATLPVEYESAIGGAPAKAVYAGDNATHRGAFMFGVLDQKEWFDSLR
ncbi:MAG: hypothetical protein RDV48_05700 [Candidatus Eremiobacteraeota bacterium]|nr:hypothetical protein [Candidatus Eremiobacteraeota bacterium]